RELALTFYPRAAALAPAPAGMPDDVRVTPLVQSSPRASLAGGIDKPAVRSLLVLAQRDFEQRGSASPSVKRSALMVAGDSDFATNRYFATLGNGVLFTRSIAYLAEQQNLLDIQPRH